MHIEIRRIARRNKYTIGQLFINFKYVCDTLENPDRLYLGLPKVKGNTAIPTGRYEVVLNNYSPKFGKKEPYKSLSNGCVPLIKNVPDFAGVRIHIGNTAEDTDGCPLVGRNTVVGKLTDSKKTYIDIWNRYWQKAKESGERIYLNII